MTAYEITSVLLALLGLVGGVVGFIRAVAADRRSAAAAAESADARADAAAALEQSAAATERIAAAVEILAGEASKRGTVLADRTPASLAALLEPGEVEWTLEHRVPANSFRLRNLGTVTARDVSILGGFPSTAASFARIGPGAAVSFSVDPGRHSRAIEVSWRDDVTPTPSRLTLPLPSPSEPDGG